MRRFSRKDRTTPVTSAWSSWALWVQVPGQRVLGCPSGCRASWGLGCGCRGCFLRRGLLWSRMWPPCSLLRGLLPPGACCGCPGGWGLLQKEGNRQVGCRRKLRLGLLALCPRSPCLTGRSVPRAQVGVQDLRYRPSNLVANAG